jgi:hypothetical protein
MISLGRNGPWTQELRLSPIERTVSDDIFVRIVASTQGTRVSRITHSVGDVRSMLTVHAVIPMPAAIFRSPQAQFGVLNFGYVPQRLTSTATYLLEVTSATTPITLVASEGFNLAFSEADKGQERLTIPAHNTLKRHFIVVRFAPRWSGIFSGAIVHQLNGTTATLRLLGTSSAPSMVIKGLGTARTIDFGAVTRTQPSAMSAYQLDCEGIANPIQITAPRGAEISLSRFGGFTSVLTLTPHEGVMAATIVVRTTEAVIGKVYHGEILHSASENGTALQASVFLTANTPEALAQADSNTDTESMTTDEVPAQSYPNPFSNETTIAWTQREQGSARVVILSSNGLVVRTLTLSGTQAGKRRIVWDGRGEGGQMLAGGVYFAHIQTIGTTGGKRVVMMLSR